MKEVGTLQELGVKAGDVVECVDGGSVYDVVVITPHTNHNRAIHCNIGELYALSRDGNNHQSVKESSQPQWRVVTRAAPKLWRDMTPEEKGVLLLAAHEGKVIEQNMPFCDYTGRITNYQWIYCQTFDIGCKDFLAYRIKPEPKVEVVNQGYKTNASGKFVTTSSLDHATHKITFNLIDGKPDCESVKMESI